jgi:hypothetical protein
LGGVTRWRRIAAKELALRYGQPVVRLRLVSKFLGLLVIVLMNRPFWQSLYYDKEYHKNELLAIEQAYLRLGD